MYPWFHHPAYPPPSPPTAGPTVFAEAANGAAAGAGQHHVYVHGMKGYGRGWGYRRGPSRLKWFVLGAVAANVFLNHRFRQRLRYGDDDSCDPRNYFWACRQRRNDLPDASGRFGPAQTLHQATSTANEDAPGRAREHAWRSRWHDRWHRAEKTQEISPSNTALQPVTSTEIPQVATPSPINTQQIPPNHPGPKDNTEAEGLLTYDSPLLGRVSPTNDNATQRERMEAEAIAFAEEKIDMLVNMLEGLKSKLESSGKTRS